jgi:DNA polymerase-3 subunit gamma/tau
VLKPPPAAGDADTAAAVRRQWSTVLEKVRERSRTLDVMLAGAFVRAVEGNTLVLMHQSAPLAKRLAEQRNAAVIEDALKDALGRDWRVRYEVGSGDPAPAPRAEPAVAPATDAQRAEEERMLAEAKDDTKADAPRRDPEEAALELLQNELGARRIDGP